MSADKNMLTPGSTHRFFYSTRKQRPKPQNLWRYSSSCYNALFHTRVNIHNISTAGGPSISGLPSCAQLYSQWRDHQKGGIIVETVEVVRSLQYSGGLPIEAHNTASGIGFFFPAFILSCHSPPPVQMISFIPVIQPQVGDST